MSERARGAELAAMTAIAAQVNCTQNLDEILGGALDVTLQVVGVDAGEVFLFDPETGELFLHAHRGLSDAFVADEAVLGPGECLCGLSAESRTAVMTSDIASHPARSRAACMREGFRSLLCLPLLARGEVLGLLNVQCRMPRQFTQADEELLTAIGNQIGIAIANAQLIDDAEQRRATLDSVMNSLLDGLVLVSRHGKIVYANPRACVLLGVPEGGLIGEDVEALDRQLSPRLAEPARAAGPLLGAMTDPSAQQSVEFSLSEPESRALLARFFPIRGATGDEQGLGVLLRDVTREKELDNLKSQLLATVSHELRTPLASIKGFATTLLREDVEWDHATRREFLYIIDQESDRLSELISNLLDMSRIEAGTLRVEPEPTDLAPVILDTVAEFEMLAGEHQFKTELPLPIGTSRAPGLPTVMADPRRARQVLQNLVENAIKYSAGGGTITVSARPVSAALEVSVADQGLGIDPQHLPHVFDRFYQVDNASTRQVGGSGLGLSICQAIVEAHGGRIWAESQPGVGSTFTFALPLEETDGA